MVEIIIYYCGLRPMLIACKNLILNIDTFSLVLTDFVMSNASSYDKNSSLNEPYRQDA